MFVAERCSLPLRADHVGCNDIPMSPRAAEPWIAHNEFAGRDYGREGRRALGTIGVRHTHLTAAMLAETITDPYVAYMRLPLIVRDNFNIAAVGLPAASQILGLIRQGEGFLWLWLWLLRCRNRLLRFRDATTFGTA